MTDLHMINLLVHLDYGKLIYDITRGLLYNVWGENGDTRVKQYLGMQ